MLSGGHSSEHVTSETAVCLQNFEILFCANDFDESFGIGAFHFLKFLINGVELSNDFLTLALRDAGSFGCDSDGFFFFVHERALLRFHLEEEREEAFCFLVSETCLFRDVSRQFCLEFLQVKGFSVTASSSPLTSGARTLRLCRKGLYASHSEEQKQEESAEREKMGAFHDGDVFEKNYLKAMMFEWEEMVSRGVFHGRNSSTPPEIMR